MTYDEAKEIYPLGEYRVNKCVRNREGEIYELLMIVRNYMRKQQPVFICKDENGITYALEAPAWELTFPGKTEESKYEYEPNKYGIMF